MKSTCEIVGRIDAKGKFVFAGTVPIPPGPAKARIVSLASGRNGKSGLKKKSAKATESDIEYRRRILREMHEKIDAIETPPDPHPEKSDDELIYGL